jgi:signal transduction histidine kinase/ActR/RegA family two-component response regulator
MKNKIITSGYSRINRLLYILFTSGLQDPDDIELRGKIIFFNVLIFIGMAVLLPFGISRLFIGQGLLGFIDLLAAAILAAILVFHRTTRRLALSSILGLSLMALLYGYLTISTGDHNTGFLWSYCLPLDVVLLLDRKRGSIVMLIYLIIMFICFIVPAFPSYYNYSANLKICYLISLMTVWVIAYYFKYIMSTLQFEVVKNNIRLQQTIQELKETKDQLFHAQKLEAIGRLAGGVAHDFNNILGAISGYAELIKQKYSAEPKIDKYATSIINSTMRAADLTAKLLAYARKGKIEMSAFDIHQIIGDVIEICKHTMEKNIVIHEHLATSQATVMGDRNQLQNAIINLSLNAKDAMPMGGDLDFSTQIVDLTEASVVSPAYSVVPGRYLKFCLSDTGTGMDAATLSKAFEPFFTTKEKGKGTGLGLSSVYGTVKSHNGYVELKSELGKGTCAEMYLPLSENVEQKTSDAPREISKGHGTVLFADDEEMIREMAAEMIKDLGYSAITCKDGQDALEYYQAHNGEIDLVILDIIMPRLGGYNCFKAMKAINPRCKAIACSGYVINDEAKNMLDQGALDFIQKPFTIKTFAAAIQAALHDQTHV